MTDAVLIINRPKETHVQVTMQLTLDECDKVSKEIVQLIDANPNLSWELRSFGRTLGTLVSDALTTIGNLELRADIAE